MQGVARGPKSQRIAGVTRIHPMGMDDLGQASRISGITPASVSLLLIHLKKGGFKGFMQAAEEGQAA